MRRLAALIMLSLSLILAPALGCHSGQQPDDIVPTPGGSAYRANVFEQGKSNPWPPIKTAEVALADNATITYRADIETRAGETRNNIILMRIAGRHDLRYSDLILSAINVPLGLAVKEDSAGGTPGSVGRLLIIKTFKGAKPGKYGFSIRVKFEGEDYGTIDCIVWVETQEGLRSDTFAPLLPLTESPKLSGELDYLIQAERNGVAEAHAKQQGIELIDGNKVMVSVRCDPDMIEEATRAARVLGVIVLEPTILWDGRIFPFMKVVIPITRLNKLAAEKNVEYIEIPGGVIEAGK